MFRLVAALLFAATCSLVCSEEVKIVVESGDSATPVAGPAGTPMPGPYSPAPGAKPEMPGKPDATAKPETQGKPGEPKKPDQPAGAKQRPTTPPTPPNAEELNLRPDAEGKITFNFKGQPWLAVLEWLADISEMSLDWQELPGDYLNLTTQRSYTIPEARDLINRHLLARGYTMLVDGEMLTVVDLKKVNPAIVPRVEPAALASQQSYSYVKVSFPVGSLLAEDVAKELQPLLPNAKLTPLPGPNRLEAMDAAINLREVQAFLSRFEGKELEQTFREFELLHAKAEDVCDQVKELLGMGNRPSRARGGSSGMPAGMDPRMAMMIQQQQQQQQQAMMQAQQQAMQGQQRAPSTGPSRSTEVHLLVNDRKNSILATAPPDKMAIIEQSVKSLDVPSQAGTLPSLVGRVQTYRLAALDPDVLVSTLEEMNVLDPSTRLSADSKNRAVIASATLADHYLIRSLVEKLDGSQRNIEVIPLRRLDAEQVAGTIEFVISGEKPKQQRRSFYFSDFGFGQSSDEGNDRFRVDADLENNRLILWANTVELEEVNNLLAKLGELPSGQTNPSTVRSLDLPPGEETDALLERLERQWKAIAPNPLVLPAKPEPQPESKPAPATDNEPATPSSDPTKPSALPPAPKVAVTPWADALLAQVFSADPPEAVKPAAPGAKAAPANTSDGEKAASPAPIVITRGPDGRLILSSSDTQALDLLEEFLVRSVPADRDEFRVFRLRHAWAFGIAEILKEIFEEDKKDSRRMPWWYDYEYGSSNDDQQRSRLSKRKPLKIVHDSDSNSILVRGADPAQLRQIEDLIKFYDTPEPTSSESVRRTEMFHLEYSKAEVVAETIKDVYRDLLSSNDKALQGGQQNQRRAERYYLFDSGEDTQSESKPKFKGALSIGADKLTNTLIVSATPIIMADVRNLIEELDQAAEPVSETVTVLQVSPGLSPAKIEELLSRLHGDKVSGSKPQQAETAKPAAKPEGKAAPKSGTNTQQ